MVDVFVEDAAVNVLLEGRKDTAAGRKDTAAALERFAECTSKWVSNVCIASLHCS